MKHILKVLKTHLVAILIVIGLLFTQAYLDLKLPEYTANIINIGIQQSGIKDNTYEYLSQSTLDKILLLSNDEEKDIIKKSYKKQDDKTYDIEEDLYVLDTKEDINEYLYKPSILLYFLSMDTEQLSQYSNNEFTIPNGMDVFTMISYMNDEELDNMINQMNEQIDEISDTIKDQFAIEQVKAEYENIGIDMNNYQIHYLIMEGLMMLLISCSIMLVTIITTLIISRLGAKISNELRSKVVSKVMSYSNKEFEELSSSSLITRSTNDIQQIQMLIIMGLRFVIYSPILGIGAFTKVYNNPMSWIIGIAILALISLIIILMVFAMPKFKILQDKIDKLTLISREILSGIPVIRAFSTENHEEKRFDEANTSLTKTLLFVNRLMSAMMPIMMFIMNGVSVLIIWVGSKYVDLGTIQVGDILAFITYTMQIIMSFLMLAMMSIMLPRAMVSIKRVAEVLNKNTSIKEIDKPLDFDKSKKGVIEFRDVYFRYPDALEDVLTNISFKANPGTTTAFIGSTGSGKSTLINLIPRFFDVTGGKILIDGINIKDASIKELRSKIGYVPQKGNLFTGTIASNIGFGLKKLNQEKIEKAAHIAQASDFIKRKEDNYKYQISQGGTNVSGGQRQRLSIARALAINPEILIFDDSFSALDFKTDAKLRKTLNKEIKSTIFIVAQRISTVINADQIVVLEKGEVVGIGTHQELMENCSVYQEIALSQLSKEELTHE